MTLGRLDQAPAGTTWLVLYAAGLVLTGCDQVTAGTGGNTARLVSIDKQPVAAPSSVPVPTPDAAAVTPIQRAFRAVFDADSPLVEAENGRSSGPQTTVERLEWFDDRQVLVTSTYLPDANQVTTGYLGIYYLEGTGDEFVVKGRWPEAISGYPHGGEPRAVAITDWFGPFRTIYAEGASSGQGYNCDYFELTELSPGAPKSVAVVPLSYDDTGAKETGATTIKGKIAAIVPGKSFAIRYTGTKNFTETWTRKGDHYVLQGKTRMKTC